MATILTTIVVIAVAGSGLMAGLLFVFSFSVMDALTQMPTSEGMKAMQLINRTILNPVFLSVLFGTALACMLVTIISAWQHAFWRACSLRLGFRSAARTTILK